LVFKNREVNPLEELVLYVPDLEKQFNRRKEWQHNMTQLSSSISNSTSHVNYIKEERKLYLRSVAFGTLEFQIILLDFEHNKVTFKRKENQPGNINEELYNLLTSYQLDFQPLQQSFIMYRPQKTIVEK